MSKSAESKAAQVPAPKQGKHKKGKSIFDKMRSETPEEVFIRVFETISGLDYQATQQAKEKIDAALPQLQKDFQILAKKPEMLRKSLFEVAGEGSKDSIIHLIARKLAIRVLQEVMPIIEDDFTKTVNGDGQTALHVLAEEFHKSEAMRYDDRAIKAAMGIINLIIPKKFSKVPHKFVTTSDFLNTEDQNSRTAMSYFCQDSVRELVFAMLNAAAQHHNEKAPTQVMDYVTQNPLVADVRTPRDFWREALAKKEAEDAKAAPDQNKFGRSKPDEGVQRKMAEKLAQELKEIEDKMGKESPDVAAKKEAQQKARAAKAEILWQQASRLVSLVTNDATGQDKKEDKKKDKGSSVENMIKDAKRALKELADAGLIDWQIHRESNILGARIKCTAGNTIMHQVVQSGRLELVRYAIELGADPKLANRDGQLPLHTLLEAYQDHSIFTQAAEIEDMEKKAAELKQKAETNQDKDKAPAKKPEDLVKRPGKDSGQQSIENPEQIKEEAVSMQRALALVVSASKDLLAMEDNQGRNAMHYAAETGFRDVVKILYAKSADLFDSKTKFKQTPRQLASYKSKQENTGPAGRQFATWLEGLGAPAKKEGKAPAEVKDQPQVSAQASQVASGIAVKSASQVAPPRTQERGAP